MRTGITLAAAICLFLPSAFAQADCGVTQTTTAQFPSDANRSSYCDTDFLIDDDGAPYDINASCTDDIFVLQAQRFASGLRFDLKDEEGIPCFSPNERATYPVDFIFDTEHWLNKQRKPN